MDLSPAVPILRLRAPGGGPVAQPRRSKPVETLRDAAHAQQIVDELVTGSFPELQGKRIRVRLMDADDHSFHSRPQLWSLVVPFVKRRYEIGVSRRVLSRMPVHMARAVLAHELAHTVWYERGGIVGLLRAVWSLIFKPAHVAFERSTDLEAIRRGFGPGLKAYVEWFYPQLTEAQRQHKSQFYLSPAEIDAAMASHRAPIWKQWRDTYPGAR